MSSKKLFDSQKLNDALVSTSLEEEVVKNAPELESADNVREQIERINRFIPHVEFNDPNNFAFYGSAKSYYEDAITRITNTFPYDGSEEEVTRFHNESNYLDKYIFDKKYPRTTGYAKFAIADDPDATAIATSDFRAADAINVGWTVGASTVEYIKFFGGPHTASNGMAAGTLATSFTGSNLYDTSIYSTDGTLALDRVGSRESNLKFKLTDGVTTEFWLNLDSDWPNDAAVPANQIIYDQWNGAASSSAGYGRLMVFVTGAKGASLLNGSNPIGVHLASGSNVWDIQFGGSTFTTGSLKDTWNHIALSFVSSSTNIEANFYLNGKLHETKTNTTLTSFGEVTGSMIGYLGAGQTAVSGAKAAGVTSMSNPFSPLSGSLDEFRYWKSERTEKEVQQNYWTHVRGGTNNEIANAELGVYFKFNEGITGDSTIDSKVLDYSGRITNGTWVNYPGSTARNTGSAIVSASAATSEYADPIIYDTHTDVKTLFSDLSATGSVHDYENQASLIDTMPGWILDEEDKNGSGDLKKLTQIVGSYFDTLHLQTQNLPKLKNNTYLSSSYKPTPFTNRMLSSAGLHVPEIFIDATLLERFANRSADTEYATDINEIKNTIYQNIYNNLIYIYKSKGTEKAFRNLMHCYGISDDVIQFNAYGNNTTFKLEDTRQSTVVRKNYVDFNDPNRWSGTVFQNSASIGHWTSDTTYVSGTNKNFANTAEIEVIFPRQKEDSNPEFFHTGFLSSSVFGHHMAHDNASTFANDIAGNDKNYQLYAVRTDYNSKDAYFVLKDRAGNFSLESPVYSNVYDNQKWNFAIRVKDAKWPQSDGPRGDGGDVFFADDDIQIECYGVNVDAGVVRNEFTLTKTGLADEYLTDKRRYYVGADRTNFKGTVVTNSDIQASSFRFYTAYLDNSVIKAHALDPENYGTKNPTKNTVFGVSSPSYTNDNHTFNEAVSLAINWDFSEVTTADSIGEFSVQDASSGSVSQRTRYDNDENLSHIVGNQYYAKGYFPDSTAAAERSKVISKQYVQSERQNLPEVVSTSDSVNVMSRDDEFFPRDPAVSQTFFAFEKSMYGIVSQEMLKMFSTIIEFNNLIGDLTNKYREDYKGLRLLRHLFFEKIENSPDLDKFIDYYKWIDSSLSIFLQQLVPASANVSDEIRVMVEDHILGRSKYRHQYPHLDYKGNERWGGDEAKLEARVKRFAELDYNWQFGHAPITNSQAEHSTWWKERAERDNTAFNTAALVDSARQTLNDIILSFNSGSAELLNTGAGATGTYLGSAYATRRFARPLKLTVDIVDDIGGGYNYPRGQKPDGIFPLIKKGGPAFWRPENKAVPDIAKEELRPVIKQEKRRVTGINTSENNGTIGEGGQVLGAIVGTKYLTPFVPFSSSVSPANGYGQSMQTGDDQTILLSAGEATGYHNDSYGDDYEVPMQGPFTERHVGGNRHRHIDLNEGSDTALNRPEAWNLELAGARSIFNEGDSSSSRLSTRPNYRRDETAKRPLNIKNIKHRTGSMGLIAGGNFNKRYETVQTSDRSLNNSYFVKSEGFSTASITPSTDAYVDGLTDYAKPVRTRTEHVIVERFSAPGDPATAGDSSGGPGMDYEAGQFSPYNNLNYRNLSVREPLQTLLTERSEQFGLRSGTSVQVNDYVIDMTASYHKVHRNGAKRLGHPNIADATGQAVYLTSSFDNYHVQHMIPRTDYQYAWITASYVSTNNELYGYLPYSGLVSASAGDGVSGIMVSAINFATASSAGIVVNDSGRRTTSIDTAKLNKAQAIDALDLTGVETAGADVSFTIFIPTGAGGQGGTAVTILLDDSETTNPAEGANTIAIGTAGISDAAKAAALIDAINGVSSSLVDLASSGNGQAGVQGVTAEEGDSDTEITLTIDMPGTIGNLTEVITHTGVGTNIVKNRSFTNGGTFVPTSFVNMNTTIVEPLSASSLTTGYPLSTHPSHYYNYTDIGDAALNTLGFAAYVQKVGNTAAAKSPIATTLQNLNSHRGNIFGYPTWKQIRVGNTQMARHLRKNNLYTHTFPSTGDLEVRGKAGGTLTIRPRFGETMIVSQSVVTDRYLPMVFDFEMRTGKKVRGKDITTDVIIESTFANGLVKFEDNDFANKLGLGFTLKNTPYREIRKMYKKGALADPSSPIVAVNRVIYKEVVYPSLANAQTNKTRGRTNYLNNFWRDEREDRFNANQLTYAVAKNHSSDFKSKPLNTAGASIKQSIWSLDGPETGIPVATHATGGWEANNESGYRPGELQNQYTHFVQREDTDASVGVGSTVNAFRRRPGVLYSRKHIFPMTASIAPSWGMRASIPFAQAHQATLPTDDSCMSTASIGRGEAVWDAPTLAGRYTGTSSVYTFKAVNPFDDGYDEWFANIKAPGQGYSIIPEFRITDHLDFYRNKNGGDFLTENLKALQIVGTPSGTTTPQNSDDDKFFTTFTNSDFLKYFEIVKKEHRNVVDPRALTLKCRAIKKFIPYDGFYPAERTVEMANAFSQSYGSLVGYSGGDSDVVAAYNTFTKPLFGPGILYNTIKAGLAVDYPIMTGSYQVKPILSFTGSHAAAAIAGVQAKYTVSASYAIASNSTSASYHGPTHAGTLNTYQVKTLGHTVTDATHGSSANKIAGIHAGQHSEGWDYRVPFEALVQPERYLANKTIVHDEPAVFASQNVTASWGGDSNNNKYRNMMHNFLAESISFFLQNGRTTEIVSKPRSEWQPVETGTPYGMRIKIFRSMKESTSDLGGLGSPMGDRIQPPTTGAWGDYPVPQNIHGSGESSFEMYSRPSAFGPPVANAVAESQTTGGPPTETRFSNYRTTGSLEFGPGQGVYASHTPPYYDGESWVDIIYYPALPVQSITGSNGAGSTTLDEILDFTFNDYEPSFVPTLTDLHSLATIHDIGSTAGNYRTARFGDAGTYVVKWRYDQNALLSVGQGGVYGTGGDLRQDTGGVTSFQYTGSNARPMGGAYANRWAMQGDASLNLFGQKGARWKISTKFETPMLNFKYLEEHHHENNILITSASAGTVLENQAYNQCIPRGMWHQFGRLPTGSPKLPKSLIDICGFDTEQVRKPKSARSDKRNLFTKQLWQYRMSNKMEKENSLISCLPTAPHLIVLQEKV
jgi:hypothetical protein